MPRNPRVGATAQPRPAEVARQAILAAAEEAFASKGFSGARVDEIAERAGYNKSLIFQYFENKLSLYREVIACARGNMEDLWTRSIFGIVADEGPLDAALARQFIREGVSAAFDSMVNRPNLRRILAWEAAEGWVTYRSLMGVHQGMQQKARIAMTFVERAQQAGYIRADIDPPLLYAIVWGLAQNYLTSLPRFAAVFPERDFASPEALAAARETLIRLVQFGMLTPAGLGA